MTTTAPKLVREFSNGAVVVEFADGVQVCIAHDNRISWATPAGWDFVLDSGIFIEKTYRIWGDQTGWPTMHDSDFYAPPVLKTFITQKPPQVEKAIDLILDGGLVLIRKTGTPVFRVVASDGVGRYLTAPQACNCKAGLVGRFVCYHRLAVQLVTA